ncbi:HSF-type DNA-binding-domain-containing protein [Umbelopsis sp. AD052]|nr:HSF-type DNA-binding-domain-containing protein [Umbelopsis sp. AD052]
MSKRRTLGTSSNSSASNVSSNSSREDSSDQTSSTSLSSGNDSSITSPAAARRKQGAKAHHEAGYPDHSRTERQRSVTAFLNKLFRMVSETSTNELIHWSVDGKSFIVEHQDDFSKTLLPRYFKHNTFASFVRQLNMYNFHKVPHVEQRTLISDTMKDIWEFSNPNFQQGRPDLLSFVYRKRIQEREQTKPESNVHALLQTSQSIRQRQSELSAEILSMKSDFQTLWNDTLELREKQQEKQEVFAKIVQFLSYITRLSVESNTNGKVNRYLTQPNQVAMKMTEPYSCPPTGENTMGEALSRKLLACPDTNELLKMAAQQNELRAAKPGWPVAAVTLSDEEVNNTIASTVRSVNAIASDIEHLNRNVELLAKRYNYNFDSDEHNYAPTGGALDHGVDNELNIIQYQHTGKRQNNPMEDHPTYKKRAGSIDMNPSEWAPPPTTNMMSDSLPTIAMRRATARAIVPPILSETRLVERFPPPFPVVVVPLPTEVPSHLVDGTSYDATALGYEDFAACDYTTGQDSINEFSGLFGPPPI